jgi:hypothetical protein
MILDHFKTWNVKTLIDYVVYGTVLALVISLVATFIIPMVVKLIPGTVFGGTISLTDMLLFFILLLTVKK